MTLHGQKKTVLVTGGAGFVGSHLCERLAKDGHQVISLDNYFTGSVENHVPGVEYRTGHTKDIAALVPEAIDVIYHLGEYARTEKSFEDIDLVWDSNKVGTFAVIEFWRAKKCKLVYAGSSTKFADQGEGRDQSPYAWTKATNTELIRNYGSWFGLPYAISYFYNVYGPRERSGAYGTLIQIYADLYHRGQPLTIVSPGTQTRNFTHVGDIIDGLVLVGERGEGDGYGIGADVAYSVREVADMFGGEILMLPERKGNRQDSSVDNRQLRALGWSPKRTLSEYVGMMKNRGVESRQEQRILVFSTTFFPDAGRAEETLLDLMRTLPSVHFDVITTTFSRKGKEVSLPPLQNVSVHRVGFGNVLDKYLLPFMGGVIARKLEQQHRYLFKWSLFASYGALAAFFSGRSRSTPILITIADQRLNAIPFYVRFALKYILGSADQVFAETSAATQTVRTLARRTSLVRSMGGGDAFANQIRFTYSTMLREKTKIS